MNRRTGLRIAAAVEAITVVLLFANLFTVHWSSAASLLGPTHGTAYLAVVIITLSTPGASTRSKVLAFVPGIGGYLVLRSEPDTPGAEILMER
jgi:hypothetical protein